MNLDPKILTDEQRPEPQEPVLPVAPPPAALATTDAFVDRVNAMTPGHITPEQITAVLAAANAVNAGADLGTILQGPRGETATRVRRDGVDMWSVSTADGGFYFDMQPTLPWTQIHPLAVDR